jgi:hypothetical protein
MSWHIGVDVFPSSSYKLHGAATSLVADNSFTAHPPPTMTNDTYRVWCLIKGDSTPFDITAPANTTIHDLKKLIKAENENGVLNGIGARSLRLWKVSGFSQL